MPQQTVRMGTAKGSRRAFVAVVVTLSVATAAGAALFAWRADEEPAKNGSGCSGNVDCGAGRVCARGGCLPIIGAEDADDWAAQMGAQLARGAAWSPRPAFGEEWTRAGVCPIPLGRAEPLEEDKVSLVHQARVFEIRADGLRIHLQKRERGTRWIDAMRFPFPSGTRVDPRRACASAEVLAAELAKGRADTLDVALKRAAPAGAIAAATVSVETELPPADGEGRRTLEIPLEPATDGAVAVSIAAVPLGAHVSSMGGPAPERQRLLSGFAAYYWRHSGERGTVVIVFELRAAGDAELPVGDLKP